jgi:hypothetical protein
MTDKEAMAMALEALEESNTDNDTMEFWDRKIKAITALKERLADHAMRETQRLGQEIEQESFEDLAPALFAFAQISPADDGFSGTIDRIETWLREHFSTPPQRTEPTCPECKAEVLYECVACSSNNYPPKETT